MSDPANSEQFETFIDFSGEGQTNSFFFFWILEKIREKWMLEISFEPIKEVETFQLQIIRVNCFIFNMYIQTVIIY